MFRYQILMFLWHFHCFMNFLCISLFFDLLFLLFFSVKFVADTFWSTIMAKITLISAIESKNKHIYVNYVKKNQFALILYTKSHFGAIFGPTCMYKKLRNFRTVPPGVTNLVSKCAGNLKEKSHERRVRNFEWYRRTVKKTTGGGHNGPPPGKLGLMMHLKYNVFLGFIFTFLAE